MCLLLVFRISAFFVHSFSCSMFWIRCHLKRFNNICIITHVLFEFCSRLCESFLKFVFNLLLTFNPLSANPKKWSNTLKQLWSVFDHFVILALKGLRLISHFFSHRVKKCSILWSVWVFFIFLDIRRLNKYCSWEANSIFYM